MSNTFWTLGIEIIIRKLWIEIDREVVEIFIYKFC